MALASPFCYDGGFFLTSGQKWQVVATTLITIFLPGLLLGILSCWHRGIFNTFLTHPSIILMPVFTHFTFVSSTKWCKGGRREEGKSRGEAEAPYITFSAKQTLTNIFLFAIGSVSYGLILTHINDVVNMMNKGNAAWEGITRSRIPYLLYYYLYNPRGNIPTFLVPIIGPFLTLLSLVFFSRKLLWCRCNPPTCFTLPKVEYGALVPSQPDLDFVLDANDQPKLVPEYEEVKLEEVQSEESELANDEKGEPV